MTLASFFPARPVTTLLWLGAFLCSLYLVSGWQLGLLMGSITLLFLWAWTMLGDAARTGLSIPKSPVLAFAAGFWALVFASVFWSELTLVSLTAFCFFSAMPLTFFAFVLYPDEKQFSQITFVMAAIFVALAVWAVVQYITIYNPFSGQAHAPLADSNSLGAFFNIALIPAIAALLVVRNKAALVMLFVFIAVITAGVLATGSRGAIFSWIPALAVLFIAAGTLTRRAKGRLGVLVLVMGAVFALSQLSGPADIQWNTPVKRLSDTVMMTHTDVTNNRLNIWDGAFDYAKHHWLLGTGFGTFFLYYPEFRTTKEFIGVSQAHSDPLQYWAELGIFGPILFYAFLIAALVRTCRALGRLPKDDPARVRILAPLCALGAVVIHAHVNFNFYNLCILFGAGFLLAVWFVETRRVLNDAVIHVGFDGTDSPLARRFYMALPFIPVLFLMGSYMASEHFVNNARRALLQDENLAAFADNLVLAHDFDRGLNFRTWLLAANIPLGILQDGANNLSDEKKKEFYDQATGQLARVRALNPRSSSALFYQAKLQTLVPAELRDVDAPNPEDLYKEALRIDPTHLGSRMALASIYKKQGKEDEAYAVLDAGIHYIYAMPIAKDYYAAMMVEYLAHGNRDMYEETKQKLIQYNYRERKTVEMNARGKDERILPVAKEDVLN